MNEVNGRPDNQDSPFDSYIDPSFFVDADHPRVVDFARTHAEGAADPVDSMVRLYYAIRDGFRYNPWRIELKPEPYKASAFLARDPAVGGHCIDKANLLAACARVHGIPSRMHFANVRNHIGTAEIERILGTSVLVFHGYTELFLNNRWVAATPAFNKELCAYFGVAALDFDGHSDSVFQQHDLKGGLFMEYVHDYGPFAELPFELMLSEWKKHYGESIMQYKVPS